MVSVIIYLLAGIAIAWSFPNDTWWQRVLLVPFWLPMIGWGMICQFGDWWRERGYQYDEDDDGRDPG